MPAGVSRHTLLSYRRSANVLKYTYIEIRADRGLLRYTTVGYYAAAMPLVRAWLPD